MHQSVKGLTGNQSVLPFDEEWEPRIVGDPRGNHRLTKSSCTDDCDHDIDYTILQTVCHLVKVIIFPFTKPLLSDVLLYRYLLQKNTFTMLHFEWCITCIFHYNKLPRLFHREGQLLRKIIRGHTIPPSGWWNNFTCISKQVSLLACSRVTVKTFLSNVQ